MTEREWPACGRPERMLEFLRDKGKIDDRKARLFLAGCCTLFVLPLTEEVLFGLDVASRLAETGGVTVLKAQVRLGSGQVALDCGASEPVGQSYLTDAHGLSKRITLPDALESMLEYLACTRSLSPFPSPLLMWIAHLGLPLARQADLVREVFGNPFRPPRLDPRWLAWSGGTVAAIGQEVYYEGRLPGGTLEPTGLAVLGDALEDAGCCDDRILDHLRSPGPHVLGCWALDLVLGKG